MKKYKIWEGQYIEVCGKKLYRVQALKDFANIKAGDTGGYIENESNLSQSGNAWVYGDARVCDNAQVSGDAQVCGNARVHGNTWVSGDAQVSGNAWVCGNARVHGNTWVSGDAQVYGNAQVFGNAQVSGDAQVSGNAWVCGNARVHGNTWVSGDAQVYGNAQVFGNAQVSGDAQVYGNAWVYDDAWVSGDARVCDNAQVSGIRHYLNLGPIGSRYGYTTIYRDKSKKAIVVCGCFRGDLDDFERAVRKTHAGTKYEAEYMALIQLARLREKEWLENERDST